MKINDEDFDRMHGECIEINDEEKLML